MKLYIFIYAKIVTYEEVYIHFYYIKIILIKLYLYIYIYFINFILM